MFHAIEVSFIGPTAAESPRIELKSLRFTEGDRAHPLTFSYDQAGGYYWVDRAAELLKTNGFDVVGVAEGVDCYYIISSTLKPLRDES